MYTVWQLAMLDWPRQQQGTDEAIKQFLFQKTGCLFKGALELHDKVSQQDAGFQWTWPAVADAVEAAAQSNWGKDTVLEPGVSLEDV